jgi:hypothetical protein
LAAQTLVIFPFSSHRLGGASGRGVVTDSTGVAGLGLLGEVEPGIPDPPKPLTHTLWQEAAVNTRRPGRDDTSTQDDRNDESIVLTAGTLRGESRYPEPTRPSGSPEDRVSLFWRVFGGTILSIVALVAITLYNHLANSVNELRAELNRVNEVKAEMVKKEEFNTRTQSMWERMQSLQELRVTVTGLKEQLSAQGEKQGDLKSMRDTLAMIEQRLKTADDDHKALAKLELTLSTLEQRAAARESQLKAAEDDRKEMVRQLQELRERLAKVEGVTEVKPMTKGPAAKSKAD